uniref:Protein kinase domain-containing protein n=1 Tax=Echeneis naucrates TaxID=173247 RepID=A0A665WTT4_ECHNA
MLVNHKQKPFRVKLIDFRTAIHTSKIRPGYIFQKVCYRAPEVILGLPWNEAIDMWSLGCVLAFLYYNQDPFPSHCQLEILKIITQMQGQFEDEMLNDAIYMRNFFTKITNSTGSSWMLKAECEFPCCTNTDTPDSSMGAFENCDSFNNIARTFPEEDSPTAQEDTQAFFSLLKRMLNADAAQRITPTARLTKKKCQHEELSVKFKRFVTSSEVISINSVTSDPDKGCSTADRGPANKRPSGHTDLNDTVVAEETVNKKKTFIPQCTRLDTKEKMAMKIVKKGTLAGKREVRVLKKLRKLDYDKNNLVRFTEHFHHKGHICLAFEMLDMSIKDLIERKLRRKPLQLSQIRVITQQMLVALNALKDIGLAHADIKPNKIMLVNHQLNPLKVKLVDFGTTVAVSKVLPGTVVQAIGYRAPEVILGLQVDEAIDIWGLGCVLAYMYLGQDLYPLHCEREVMRVITKVQGQPSAKMLNNGIHTIDHFNHSQGRRWSFWTLKKVCGLSCCKSVKGTKTNHPMGALDRVTMAEIPKDTDVFLSFLKQMLHVEPEERLTPIQALEHAFIFTKHSPADANLSSHLPSRDDKANETNNHDKFVSVHIFLCLCGFLPKSKDMHVCHW